MKLKWLPIATIHADNCYEFLAQKDKKAALSIYRKMTEGAAFLAKNPYGGPLESSRRSGRGLSFPCCAQVL